jgi:hypothetical protein
MADTLDLWENYTKTDKIPWSPVPWRHSEALVFQFYPTCHLSVKAHILTREYPCVCVCNWDWNFFFLIFIFRLSYYHLIFALFWIKLLKQNVKRVFFFIILIMIFFLSYSCLLFFIYNYIIKLTKFIKLSRINNL